MNFGVLTGIRVSHREAGVQEIEAATLAPAADRLDTLIARDGVREAFVLQTCNRVEEYVVTPESAAGRTALADLEAAVPGDASVRMSHEAGLRHLLRVAAGLESLVLGEDQILGQFRSAYEIASSHGAVGPVLEDTLLKAIHVGERARTETGINDGITSLGSAAVALAQDRMALSGITALVVGTGEIGTKAAAALGREPVERLYLSNRTRSAAADAAADIDAPTAVVPFASFQSRIPEVDFLVTATASSDPILDTGSFSDAGDTLVIDLGQPRDVDPAVTTLPGVALRDLDDLKQITERTRRERRAAADRVDDLIETEFENLLEGFKRKRADAAIRAMYESADAVKRSEVETAINRLSAEGDLTDDERDVLESMADSLVNKLLAPPTRSLRRAAADDDWSTINTALQLFDPDFDHRPGGEAAPIEPDSAAGSARSTDSASSPIDDD